MKRVSRARRTIGIGNAHRSSKLESRQRAGVLDFVDLLLLTRDLLQNNEAVRRSLQQRFTRIFVDEFQDTDPLQSEIVLLLSSEDPRESRPFSTRACMR